MKLENPSWQPSIQACTVLPCAKASEVVPEMLKLSLALPITTETWKLSTNYNQMSVFTPPEDRPPESPDDDARVLQSGLGRSRYLCQFARG